MSPGQRALLVGIGLVGLGASAIASYVHYTLLAHPDHASFCDISATVSCTQAYLSRYGSLFGVPVALLGTLYFLLVLFLAGFVARAKSSAGENAAEYLVVISGTGLAFSIYLAWASYAVLDVFCILCAITYGSVIAILMVSIRSARFTMRTLPRRAARDLRTLLSSPRALAVLALVLAVFATAIAPFLGEPAPATEQDIPPVSPEERARLEAWWNVQPKVDLPVSVGAGVKAHIVMFSDYQCPGCRAAHDTLRRVLPKYDRSVVELVLKHYPLEPECNPNVGRGQHLAACEAAAACVMAAGTGFQQKLDDWLFANQATLTPDVVRRAAKDIAGIGDFDGRYAKALVQVRADASLGGLLGLKSTPTIYLNGRMIAGNGQGLAPASQVDAIIDIALKKGR